MENLNPYLGLVARLETAGGKKTIKGPNGKDSFNLFNIKQFDPKKPGFRALDKAEGSRDAYRVYSSYQESQADMEDLLRRRYPEAYAAMQKPYSPDTVQEFAEGLKSRGYATDPDYVQKLVGLAGAAPAPRARSADPIAAANRPAPAAVAPDVSGVIAEAFAAQEVEPSENADALPRRIAADIEEETARRETGLWDATKTAFADPRANPIWNIIDRYQTKPPEDPSFSYYDHPDRAKWEGKTQNLTELQFLRENATSAKSAEWALARIEADRERDKVYGRAGTAATLAAQLGVGIVDPVGWIAGAGAGKVAQLVGSAVRAGRVARAATALGAGVGGNVAWEAIQDGLGEVKGVEDYAMSAAFGAAFTVPFLPSAMRGDPVLDADLDLQRRADDVAVGSAQARREADVALTPDQQARAIAEDVQAAGRASVDEDAAIVPADIREIDELEVPAAPPTRPVAPPAAPPATQAPAASAAPPSAPPVQPEAPSAPAVSADQKLPRELAGAKPRYRNSEIQFESDLDKALYIVAASGRLSKSDGQYMAWLRQQFPDMSDADIRAEGALVRAKLKTLEPENGVVRVPKADPLMGPAGEGAQAKAPGEPRSLREALTGAAEAGAVKTSGMFRETFSYLLRAIPANVLDSIVVNHELGRGRYDQLKRRLYSPMADGPEGVTRAEAQTLAHEAVHAATAHIMQAVREGARGVTQLQKQAVQRLEELRKEMRRLAQEQGVDLSRNNTGIGYALNSPIHELDEFVAQVMSDPETRTFMAAQAGRGYQADNMLEAFYRAIMAALGFNPRTVKPDTALYDAMVQIDTLIRTGGDFGGTDVMLQGPSPQARAITDQKFADRMYQHARAWVGQYGIDATRLETLAQQLTRKGSTVRDYLVSDGLKMAASKNPIVQMLSGLLVETTTGAAGRQNTAAIQKKILGQRIVGTSVNDYHTAYADYRKRNGGGHVEDHLTGEVKRKFDREVYEEILRRRYGIVQPVDGAVRAGADSMERLFQRSLDVQKEASTLGSGLLPPDSVGYAPQQLNADALAAASAQDLDELAQHLGKHWQGVYGWSGQFSTEFSRYYINRARKRATQATSGVDFVALESPTSAVRDTLEEMRLQSRSLDSRTLAELDRVGAMPSNKRRLDVNPLASLPSGKKVLDFYTTDTERLARSHANSVAGHAALASKGILGKRGVNNLLMSIENAAESERATPDEVAALKRSFSEFLGTPFDGERRSELAAGLASFTRLQRLGGLAFTQFAEGLQLVHHLGLSTALKAMGSIPRQVLAVRDLANGKQVANSWLASIEQHQGFEFGMESFRMVSRLDPPDELLREYGKGSSLATRLLASGNHLQVQVSFFRGLHAAQHRATAEHILKRAIGYIQDGNVDTDRYLQDMGISPQLARAIRQDLPQALIRNPAGDVIGFDIGGLSTQKARDQLTQAVHRGTAQIIQDTFIGERGAWASDDWAKVLLQLRTFGLTAMEKQWGRTRAINSNGPLNGYGYTAGVLVGQMAFGAMIYAGRAQVYAAGREDREEFLERAYAPAAMVQAALNYSSMSGLGGDALDLLSSIAGGWSDDVRESLGTRSFATGVGGLVPVAGTVDAGLRIVQGKADLHTALKQLPGSNLPWIVPILNLAKED